MRELVVLGPILYSGASAAPAHRDDGRHWRPTQPASHLLWIVTLAAAVAVAVLQEVPLFVTGTVLAYLLDLLPIVSEVGILRFGCCGCVTAAFDSQPQSPCALTSPY